MKILKHMVVLGLGLLSVLYLLNMGAGIIEFIPDNIPIIGNLDEAAAAALLLNCLSYFGLDFRRLLRRGDRKQQDIDVSQEGEPARTRFDRNEGGRR